MKIQSALTATALAGILILGTDYLSFAATGGSFLLGKSNTASHTTTLTNKGAGSVLSLKSTHPTTRAPLSVNSKVKVAKLNADLVDGKSANDLGVKTRLFEAVVSETGVNSFGYSIPSVPAGNYLVTLNGWLYVPSNTSTECYVTNSTTGRFLEDYDAGNSSGYSTVDQSGLLAVAAGDSLDFNCYLGASGNVSSFDGQPVQISLTRISSLTSTGLTKPVAPKNLAHAPSH